MIAEIGNDIEKATNLLIDGSVVAIPTETVYGLSANALSCDAVLEIFRVKERPKFDPLIVHVGKYDDLKKYIIKIPEKAKALAKKFWPGPLSIILEKKDIIPDIVTSGLKKVAIRIPNHKLTLELLNELTFPLAAPSANPFGYISPTSPEHVMKQLKNKIPYILDGGECKIGLESTIIDFEGDDAIIRRSGGLSVREIEKTIGKIKYTSIEPNLLSPGMLNYHYQPLKPLYLGSIERLLVKYKTKRIVVISFKEEYKDHNIINNFVLSPEKNLNEAAKNLFKFMRLADETKLAEVIIAERVPSHGLGLAINDRLEKASIK